MIDICSTLMISLHPTKYEGGENNLGQTTQFILVASKKKMHLAKERHSKKRGIVATHAEFAE